MPSRREFPGPFQPGRKPQRPAPLLSLAEAVVLAGFLACVCAALVSLECWANRPAGFRLAPGGDAHPLLSPPQVEERGLAGLPVSFEHDLP